MTRQIVSFLSDHLVKDIGDLRQDFKMHVSSTNKKLQKITDDLSSFYDKRENTTDNMCKLTDFENDKEDLREELIVMSDRLHKKLDSMTATLTSNIIDKTESCVKYCKHLSQSIEETSQKEVIDETPNTHSISPSSKKPNVIPNDKKSFKVPQSEETNSDTRNKKETLVIGDSILKGIQLCGLRNNVRVMTCRGKRLLDISTRLGNMNLDRYDSIIVYVGGNDAANKTPISSLYEEFDKVSNKKVQSFSL